ncbi:quinolinate synthase NadA [Candidatus Margulisiibacteriota bacterium]
MSTADKIKELCRQKNAIVLAHIYQNPEVQDIADFVGDSLDLSRKAANNEADIIIFCGVKFMAETAAILSPQKKVLLPDLKADCPMAQMISAKELREKKKEHPKAAVVCYVNSTAEVKAESDICCTSSNAVKVVKSLKEKEILFVPDQSLGYYVSTQVPDKKFIFWPGFCPTHHRIIVAQIENIKKEHPDAKFAAHPECTKDVLKLADFIGSTGQIIRHMKENKDNKWIIGSENGMIYTLQKANPDKKFLATSELATCPNMKLTSLDKILEVLEKGSNRIVVEEKIAKKAKKSIENMLAVS